VKARGGILALLLALAAAACGGPPPPDILLITMDTTRADHLSVYGYRRQTTPALEALSEEGVVFGQAFAPIPETGPSCAALLTGRWPAELGMRGNGQPLPADVTTLAGELQAAGYRTAAFVSGYPLRRRLAALDRGFEHYDDELPDARGRVEGVQRLAPRTTEAALAWLQRQASGPIFLWVHYYDPHGDYAPAPPFDARFAPGPGPRIPAELIPEYQRLDGVTDAAVYVSRYDGEIALVDRQIERLLAQLEDSGRRQRTVIAVTADHGESLTEHGYYFDHGNELYGPSLRVPLLLAGPGVPGDGRRLDAVVRLPDLMPTLLELAGRPAPPGLPARSLIPLWSGATALPREAVSEARFQAYRALTPGADVGPKVAVRDERFTVILRLDGARLEVYDRLSDPDEVRDLMADPRAAPHLPAGELAERLRRRLAADGGGDPAPMVLAADMRVRLEAAAARAAAP
jgi:arylsulfatase A-like enzyme